MDTQTTVLEIPVPTIVITFSCALTTALRTLNDYIPPPTKYFVAIILFSYFIKHVLDLIIHTFFDTPPHHLPVVIAFLLFIAAGYLHLRITVEDELALRSSEEAAENEERDRHVARAEFRERVGGLDRDVWQGGPELRKRGWGDRREDFRG